MSIVDKNTELERYDSSAALQIDLAVSQVYYGSQLMPVYLATPYLQYERLITENVKKSHSCLEIGAGTGMHTKVLLDTGANIVVTDISKLSLEVIKKKFSNGYSNFVTEVADMESLPFSDSTFDAIFCAGSLSYGDPLKVDAEIRRVLRNDGFLIFVDSLGHNPVFRLNRWLHYLRNNRTKSTLERMPTISRIEQLSLGFSYAEVSYFGGVIYLCPILNRIFGAVRTANLIAAMDSFMQVEKSAFKFILFYKNFSKGNIKK